MSNLKVIHVTEQFLGLGEKVTHCQVEEYREDCLSRKYRERVLSQCICSPFYLRSYYGEDVSSSNNAFIIFIIMMFICLEN